MRSIRQAKRLKVGFVATLLLLSGKLTAMCEEVSWHLDQAEATLTDLVQSQRKTQSTLGAYAESPLIDISEGVFNPSLQLEAIQVAATKKRLDRTVEHYEGLQQSLIQSYCSSCYSFVYDPAKSSHYCKHCTGRILCQDR